MSIRSLVASVAVGLLASRADAQCRAYGKDFQNKGIYFQNASSTEQFSFVQYFEGCQQDLASNILIDPLAEEYQCTKTPLTPDNTDQEATCPITKNNLYSGDWSIIIASNNGKAEPIAYERDFSLIVGVPTTFTFFPTVTVTATKTPTFIRSITTTSPATTTTTRTITAPLVTIKPTTTITPARVTATTTQFTSTVTKKAFTAEPFITTSIYTKTCSIPPSQSAPDTTAQYSPTLLTATAAQKRAESTATVVVDAGEVNLDNVRKSKAQFIEERRKRLEAAAKIARRGLDMASTTITATDPSLFITSTSVVTGTVTTTVTTTVEVTSFSTVTTTSTFLTGTTTLKQTTITAPTPTSTKTVKTNKTVTTTITQKPFITIIIPTVTPGASASCKSRGGKLV